MQGEFGINHGAPLALVVMGVSGSGKSTLGALLAQRLACEFLEGDSFHSADNVEKMRHGTALTDADRWPWLDHLGQAMGQAAAGQGLVVVACSALRRSYRERLAAAAGQPVTFILLTASASDLSRRMGDRPGHYMPASLLESQLQTLEQPGLDEGALVLDASAPVEVLCEKSLAWLAQRSPSRPAQG